MEKVINTHKFITADLDYIVGHLRYAHYELELDEHNYKDFCELSEDEKEEFIKEYGTLVLDDWEVDEYGPITKIEIN